MRPVNARRFSAEELHVLRNHIPIAGLLDHLQIPWKIRDGLLRFLCPVCFDFHSGTHPQTNLARCFRCERNFNTIDLVILVRRATFVEAVRYLREHRHLIRDPRDPRAS
jgi:hypothetical protein